MSLMEWDGTYSIGIRELDDHHQHLFMLINRAFDGYNQGMGDTSVRKLLEEMLEYAVYHFSAEEMRMGEDSYPGIGEHHNQHRILTDQVAEMMELHGTVGSSILSSTLMFMNTWLTRHILQYDRDYARYCSEHLSDTKRPAARA